MKLRCEKIAPALLAPSPLSLCDISPPRGEQPPAPSPEGRGI